MTMIRVSITLVLLLAYSSARSSPLSGDTIQHEDQTNDRETAQHIKDNNSPDTFHTDFHGFSARLSYNQNYVNGDVIVFDGVTYNEDANYFPSTGRYRCPVDGVYYVSVTIKKNGETRNQLRVYNASTYFLELYDDPSRNPGNTITNSGLTKCNEGDLLYVAAAHSGTVYGFVGVSYSSFSAFRVGPITAGGTDTFDDDFVGFTAKAPQTVNYLSGDRLDFSEIVHSDESNYFPQLSQFRCPEYGLYFIAVNFRHNSASLAHHIGVDHNTEIVINSDDPSGKNQNNMISNSRLVECSQGDFIWVRATGSGHMVAGNYSTFTVFKVSSDRAHGIGFTRVMSQTKEYVAGDNIIFDGRLVEWGDGYSSVQNAFVCPTSGIYYVSVNAKKSLASDLHVYLEVNTVPVFGLEDVESDNEYNTISNNAVVKCQEGWTIKLRGNGDGYIMGDFNERDTTFTVFMVYALPA